MQDTLQERHFKGLDFVANKAGWRLKIYLRPFLIFFNNWSTGLKRHSQMEGEG